MRGGVGALVVLATLAMAPAALGAQETFNHTGVGRSGPRPRESFRPPSMSMGARAGTRSLSQAPAVWGDEQRRPCPSARAANTLWMSEAQVGLANLFT